MGKIRAKQDARLDYKARKKKSKIKKEDITAGLPMQESRLFKIVYHLLDKGQAAAPELAQNSKFP